MGVEVLAAVGVMEALQIAGVAAGVGGGVMQMQGQKQQAAGSKKAEGLRKEMMELNSARKQREIIRKAQLARATSLSRATAQGVQSGDSAVQGSYGQIEQDATNNLNFERSALGIGRGIFDANAQSAEAGSMIAFGQGISTIGSALIRQSGPLNDLSRRTRMRELGSGGAP